jgi:hypothetical protein
VSPTARSLEYLRRTYPLVQVVEKWIPQARRRVDLYGIGDILAVSDTDIVLVQTTSSSNVAARIRKIADSPATPTLRNAGIRIVVHGWAKSRRTGRYELREVDCS